MCPAAKFGASSQMTEDRGQKQCRGYAAFFVNVPQAAHKHLSSVF